MKDLIAEFQTTHLVKLRRLAISVSPADLDNLPDRIRALQDEIDRLTPEIRLLDRKLYQSDWKPILDEVYYLIPRILGQLEDVRDDTRERINQLGKGQRGIQGYRPENQRNPSFFDSDG